MVDPRLVAEWLIKADEDFGFALVNLEEGKPFHAQICFHFHQAAEKYLKAYIVAHALEFRKVHDLPLLLKLCASHDSSAGCLQEACDYLNAFYIETRYPVHWPTHYSDAEASSARDRAGQIKAWVDSKVGSSRTVSL
jgi:HEPN domain-containing protein